MNSATIGFNMKRITIFIITVMLSLSALASHINDHKRDALLTLLSVSDGNISDLERTWLLTAVISPAGNSTNDLWLRVFLENSATSPNWNGAASEFLAAQGHSGNISGMWHDYWEDGGGAGVPNNALIFTNGDAFQFTNGDYFETTY